jgi:hypothetical protein
MPIAHIGAMRERDESEPRTEPPRAPSAKPEQRERQRRSEAKLEPDPDNPAIFRGVD